MTSQNPLEGAALVALPWLIAGLVSAAPLLLVPASADRRLDLLVHLSALVAFSLGLTWRLVGPNPAAWFASRPWSPIRRHLAALVSLVVIVTGVTALVTLATSAALRYEASLQFLQKRVVRWGLIRRDLEMTFTKPSLRKPSESSGR